ncbi:MAG TPA: peptidylprolyl isomerase [Gammaproteobacteria bacterium]|nr:peptidylprolyl isomerase [Gammaproteobacteria bacterium]
MLHFIRERAQGWIAWVIVGLLIIPFALWGINQYFGNGGKLVAATVNGEEISQSDFQTAFYEQRSRMQEMLGSQYDAQLFDPQIKKRVINELVDRELLLQHAEDMGFRVSDETVVATIQSIDAFREDGVFSASLYQQQLQTQGQSPASFERRVKRMMLAGQLPDGLAVSIFITDAELARMIKLEKQQRDFQFFTLSTANYSDEASVDDAAIKAYYEQHVERFMTPEKVRVEYVELSASGLKSDKEPTEEELREFYEANKDQYGTPEERRASHILIQLDEGADEAAVEAARKKAEALVARLRAGESFEKLAKENSDDPGSAETGGDLGFFGRGVMEPDFESAAFSMKKGEISDPILTSFGYHIIKLTDIRGGASKSFDEVRDEIREQFKRDAKERKYFELADKLTNLAYESPDSLSEVADTLGLELKQSPYFTRRGGPGIFANPKVLALAFSDEVLKQGYNSEPIELGENHVVVLRLLDHQEAARRPLEEVKEQVKQLLVQEKAREAVKAAGEKAVQQLRGGESSDTVLQNLSAKWQAAKAVLRDAKSPDAAIVRQAFRLNRPSSADSPEYGGVVLASGDYAVIRLDKVVDGDPTKLDAAEKTKLRRQLAGEQGANAQMHLIAALRAKAKINIQADDL